ncbi:hypothetical protein E2P86_01695 [Sphingobacterium psychroaquaticum]|uniref:hypothetical protein n=1 Tax=Sphingobacterium psychroaquaticum TaxID=561061 RepID=UPI00106DBE07|nr:hypothetical protein [Sphingobacterium psychroaquaticum]QBQ39932.1 hypothetical protein E2P86_01695 [Sphingobacterium psychroaquaticum]
MNRLKTLASMGLLLAGLISCNQQSGKETTSTTSTSDLADSSMSQSVEPTQAVNGNYVSEGYQNRSKGYDWVGISVETTTDSTISVYVHSRTDVKKPTCTLDPTPAKRVKANVYQALLQEKPVLFTFSDTSVTISPLNQQDEGILHYYCSGGATLAGSYHKTSDQIK